MSEPARTPLYSWHQSHGGRIVDFAGWSMPVQYSSIVEEHQATRQAAGLFDISHMGRVRFSGPDAMPFLERLLTRRVSDLRPGSVRYSLVTNDQGGILDDVLVYCLADGVTYLMVVNASNRVKILQWLASRRGPDDDVNWDDETARTAMLAVQGPKAIDIAEGLVVTQLATSLPRMRYYTVIEGLVGGTPALISRTGYTGEDGIEIIVAAEQGEPIWQQFVDRGQPLGLLPAGLGARDTLRLEAGMPLYGHELSEQTNPLEADLAFAVQLQGREFPGAPVLREIAAQGPQRRRIGLKLNGRRVPREQFGLQKDGAVVGEITSGTFSPTLNQPIAMAYVQPDCGEPGTALHVDIRGRLEDAQVVPLPFYRRSAG